MENWLGCLGLQTDYGVTIGIASAIIIIVMLILLVIAVLHEEGLSWAFWTSASCCSFAGGPSCPCMGSKKIRTAVSQSQAEKKIGKTI